MIKEATEISAVNMQTWFTSCEKSLRVEIERIPVADSKEWQITTMSDGKPHSIEHVSNRLHKITFLRAWEPLRKQWVDRCLLEPVAEGRDKLFSIVLLAKYKEKYLVQAKGEPGNLTPNRVVITPTIQSSFTNMDMKLSGKVYFTELHKDPACKKFRIVQDGGQLLNKINELCFLELKKPLQDIPEHFYWATLAEIQHFAAKGLVSEHLMQTLGVMVL